MVLGYALDTQYELTVELVEAQRELRPAAALALGQVGHSTVKNVPLNAQHVARVVYRDPSTAKDCCMCLHCKPLVSYCGYPHLGWRMASAIPREVHARKHEGSWLAGLQGVV